MNLRWISCAVLFVFFVSALPAHAGEMNDPAVAALNPNAQQIFNTVMQWGDRCWDPQSKLLRDTPQTSRVSVRESSWYALGLLLRNAPGDNERAMSILNVVLEEQYNAPGMPYDGTFRRNLDEPDASGATARMWQDYDPNWREFIGTTFALMLEEFPDRIPANMRKRLNASIEHAVAGEIHNKRLVESYTNPTLMFGFLWGYAAVHTHRQDWMQQSMAWQKTVYHLFSQHGTFNEYNSPTYSGVDLYALSLWRRFGATEQTRVMGSAMEAGLWRDLARFYNANLHNVSGPFDRSYGMDMKSYVTVVGVALRTVMDAREAPLPEAAPPVEHGGDLWLTPHFVLLGVKIPPDAMRSFRAFEQTRQVKRITPDGRIAEAWITPELMYGGEITGRTRDVSGDSQLHPATAQWRAPDGSVAWIALTQAPPLDVSVSAKGLRIACDGAVQLRIHAPGIRMADVKEHEWKLPGLDVRVKDNAREFAAHIDAGDLVVQYSGISGMDLGMQRQELGHSAGLMR